MKISSKDLARSIAALTKCTYNKFWGALAIISSIDETIVPKKMYKIDNNRVMRFLDDLFFLGETPNTITTGGFFHVEFSSQWIDKLNDLTIKERPSVIDLAILYCRRKEINSNDPKEIIELFYTGCNIRKNGLEKLFNNNPVLSDFSVEASTSEPDLIKQLELSLGKKRDGEKHISLENPFFIKAKPSALRQAPFFQTLYSGDKIKELMRISDSNLTDLYEAKVSSDTKPFSSTGSLLADFRAEIEVSGFTFSKSIIDRFVCALLTKPFVILTGLSGSGKTKLAHSFAKWICTSEKQYCLIPVGADWTSREPLLGFPDALQMDKYVYPDNGVLELLIRANKEEHEDEPHFLILDEMNLSHVERYFADFLSAMESKEKIPLHSKKEIKDVNRSILLPPNLFIIGTVNIDETTYMFSPKVLDRSNVIEFRIAQDEIDGFLDNYGNSQGQITIGKGAMMAQDFVERAGKLDYDYANKSVSDVLKLFFKELKKAGAEFGYRSGGEILRWAAIAKSLDNDWKDHDIIDAAIMQKLLPKLHGSQKKLSPVLTKLMTLCLRSKNSAAAETIFKKTELAESDFVEVIYPLSFEKLHRMYRNAVNNSFTSYAEA